MNLEKGQRWKNKSSSIILEIIDVKGQCIVRYSGSSGYKVGYIDYWGESLKNAARQHTEKTESFWEYLEGQDAPV